MSEEKKSKIGPKEAQLRAMREARAEHKPPMKPEAKLKRARAAKKGAA